MFGFVMVLWFAAIGVLGADPDRAPPVRPRRPGTAPRGALPVAARHRRRSRGPRRGRPRRHRRGGPVRRHGALRCPHDPPGVDGPRLPGARPVVLRAGREAAVRRADHPGQRVLQPRPVAAADPDGAPRVVCHDHREPGADLRRLQPHPVRVQPRADAAGRGRAHEPAGRGPDLHARGQLGSVARLLLVGPRVPAVARARGGLRARRHRDHAHHHHRDVLHRPVSGGALVPHGRGLRHVRP